LLRDEPALSLRANDANEQKQPGNDEGDIFQGRLQQVSRDPLRNSGDFASDLSTPEVTSHRPCTG
jgi:hypothetical protein